MNKRSQVAGIIYLVMAFSLALWYASAIQGFGIVSILAALAGTGIAAVPVMTSLAYISKKEDKVIESEAATIAALEASELSIPQFELVAQAERDEIDLHLTRLKTGEQTLEASLINPDCVECSGTRYVAGYVVYRLVRDENGWCPNCTLATNKDWGGTIEVEKCKATDCGEPQKFGMPYCDQHWEEFRETDQYQAARVRAGLDSKENQEAKLKWFAEQGPEYVERMVKAGQMLPSYADRVLQYASSATEKPKVGDAVKPTGEMKLKYGRYDNTLNYWKDPGSFVIAEIDGQWLRILSTTNWVSGPVAVVTSAPKQNEIAKHLVTTVKKCVVTDCTFPSLNTSKLCEYCKGIYDEDGEVMTSTSAPFKIGDKVEAIADSTKAYMDAETVLFCSIVKKGYCGVVKEVHPAAGRIRFAKYWYNIKDFKLVKRVKVKPQPRVAKG